MSWEIGYDSNWNRDVGYGVPSVCDHPECNEEIHRGLSYICGEDPMGRDYGCGLYFCSEHLFLIYIEEDEKIVQVCQLCWNMHKTTGEYNPFEPKPDPPEWVRHKLSHKSWAKWRVENPEETLLLRGKLEKR